MNRLAVLAAFLGLVCFGAAAQTKPVFEAVSIKPALAPTREMMMDLRSRPVFNVDAARVEIRHYSLLYVLVGAFKVQMEQIVAPDFVHDAYFDIQAALPAGTTKEQVPEMLRNMLAERFRLTYHRESREYLETSVILGKGGMKLTRLPGDTRRRADTRVLLADGATRTTIVGSLKTLFPVMDSFGGFPHMVDETGLDGMYTWVLTQSPVGPGMTYQEVVHDAYENMIEAAGLKLETRKTPKDAIMVDHLERSPTEN